jgi:putative acetyltransferase
MLPTIDIRSECDADHAAIRAVVTKAFSSGVEARLVDLLRQRKKAPISLVANLGDRIVGHALFSPITIESAPEAFRGLGLAPVAVLPDFQRRGIGSRLIREGLERCREGGYDAVVVLGHPAYYPRFGFRTAGHFGLGNEYNAADAFMVLGLKAGITDQIRGLVRYAPEFQELGC